MGYVDGLFTDNNAVGETMRVLDKIPEDRRPKNLINFLTGYLIADGSYDLQVALNYFAKKVKYRQLCPELKMLGNLGGRESGKADPTLPLTHPFFDFCPIKDMRVNNPNWFFEYVTSTEPMTFIRAEHCSDPNSLFSINPQADCRNLAWQTDKVGAFLVPQVKATKNSFWGTEGGF